MEVYREPGPMTNETLKSDANGNKREDEIASVGELLSRLFAKRAVRDEREGEKYTREHNCRQKSDSETISHTTIRE